MSRWIVPACFLLAAIWPWKMSGAAPASLSEFTGKYCTGCHNGTANAGGLDLKTLPFDPRNAGNFAQWVKVHDRVGAGEMPPKSVQNRPVSAEREAFLRPLKASLSAAEVKLTSTVGRATQRRLNAYEYENALRDLLHAPWLQLKGQFPEDGEAFRFNKASHALDVSHVHVSRYMNAADYAIRQVLSVQATQPRTATTRYYAREQRELFGKINANNQRGDRATYPILGLEPQPAVFAKTAPMTVGPADPDSREKEAVAWVSSNYVTGFRYKWDGFQAPVAGRYRIRFKGYTLWVAPLPGARKHLPDFEHLSRGRRDEAINVYTRNGVLNRHVGGFDLTPEPAVHEVGEVWLLAGETLVPDASRLYRSRPNNFRNPLMQADGAPAVAFQWMEVDGPLYDASTTAGYRLLFGDLPLKPNLEVASTEPTKDAERLMSVFLRRVYRNPRVDERDIQRFVELVEERRRTGLSFTEAMIVGYTAVLASPAFLYVTEEPGRLSDYELATRLSLFLWNSVPDEQLRARAARGELNRPAILRAETERMLADPKSRRFVEAFLDYWIDLRKMEDSTPSAALYNDYYLDDALTEAAAGESRLFFEEMLRRDLPVRNVVDSDFTFLNERLAVHYGITDVKGVAMRRVDLSRGPRGGFMTQASVLKITANGTTTSPVLRGKWITERILGFEIRPPPAVPAVEPDIRGAVTIRQQLEKHRADPGCASCHGKMDPPGFALESFDVMGGWRDRYRGVDESKPAEKGIGKNGQPFAFHYALPVDSTGVLPDGHKFTGIRDLKQLLLTNERQVALNLVRQLTVYATGVPVRFGDRTQVEQMVDASKASQYGLRSIVHQVVQSDLFRNK